MHLEYLFLLILGTLSIISSFCVAGNSYKLRTPPGGVHMNSLSMATKYFVFRLRACEHAFVNLTKRDTVVYTFEIGANNNERTHLYKLENGVRRQLTSAKTEGLLDCEVLRQLWVSFDEDTDGHRHLRFGQGGTPYESSVLFHTDIHPELVQGLIMGNDMPSGDAEWEFSRYAGTYHKNRNSK